LAETKAHLAADGSDAASAALDYLLRGEQAGDFTDFSVENGWADRRAADLP
jgi:hypothetical protein